MAPLLARMRLAALVWAVLALAACAATPQAPVTYDERRLDPATTVVGIASTPVPKVNTYFPGAGCLLCIAAAELMHRELSAHVQQLEPGDLPRMKQLLADKLARRGFKVKVIDTAVDLGQIPSLSSDDPARAKRDYAAFARQHGVDRVLVVDLKQVGVERNFQNYVPAAPPRAVVRGEAYLINASTGRYDWFHAINVLRGAEGEWREPPKYPALTNAFFETVEVAKDELLKPF